MVAEQRGRVLDRLLQIQELFILVWGPGPDAGGEGYEKREKLRSELQAAFPYAEVYFSEDAELDEKLATSRDWPISERELYHLAACHLCIVLDISYGAGQEVARYSHTQYASRLLVLTPEEHKESTSYAAQLRESLLQQFFTPEEFRECNLVERALARARQVALSRLSLDSQ